MKALLKMITTKTGGQTATFRAPNVASIQSQTLFLGEFAYDETYGDRLECCIIRHHSRDRLMTADRLAIDQLVPDSIKCQGHCETGPCLFTRICSLKTSV